jgi:hypothetical protein
MDAEKLTKWSKEIYDNAVAHGWHEEKHSPKHYLGLIMTEVAEAVEADRHGRRADIPLFQIETDDTVIRTPDVIWKGVYEHYIKGTIEEEFSDIVIRLLDMAYALYGEDFAYYNHCGMFRDDKTFIEHAYYFVKEVLNSGVLNISYSICYIYDWAEHLGIDLDQHIEWKMRYNSLREYKHGGKKY